MVIGRIGKRHRGTEETYRNSCLAVLVGEVGKSSSLPVREAEKQKTKRTQQNMIKKSNKRKERANFLTGNLRITRCSQDKQSRITNNRKITDKITKGKA